MIFGVLHLVCLLWLVFGACLVASFRLCLLLFCLVSRCLVCLKLFVFYGCCFGGFGYVVGCLADFIVYCF